MIDRFFREGMERAADTEDLITIGMRGDGDTPMGGKEGEDDKYVPRDEEKHAPDGEDIPEISVVLSRK